MKFLGLLLIVLVTACNSKTMPEEDVVPEKPSNKSLTKQPQKAPQPNSIPIIGTHTILPDNQASKIASYKKFEIKLKYALSVRDTTILFKLMDSSVISSHGGGIVSFWGIRETWERDYTKMWEKLDKIVGLGGQFEGNDSIFYYPYCQRGDYMDCEGDWYSYAVTLQRNTPLYTAPKKGSDTLAYLRYAIGNIDLSRPVFAENGFFKFFPCDSDVVGYVKEEELYRAQDYSLFVELGEDGIWRITSFAPYD